jgi:glycosyltransferase involved in cell wall biosynthesis
MMHQKYNIGIIANPVADEGKNVYLTKFINTLKPLSNEIFVIDGDFPEVPDKKIHIIRIKADEKKESMLIRSIKCILTQLRFSINLIKISKKIDVIIFFGATELIPLLLMKFMRKRTIVITGGLASKGAKKVYRERLFGLGSFVFPLILRTLENIGLIFSDRIAVESESVIKFLGLERYRDKISIISNMYLDINKFKIKKDLDSRRILIGFISRLEEGKGIMNFVKAIPLVLKERSDLEFLIGGDGRLFNEIRNELKNNKELDNKVELTGWIPHDRLPEYLNELKLLVFPSYSEGLPNIVSESMACGTPVLATPVGGIPDIIDDGETGFIMEDNAPECIAENVIRVLNHPNVEEIAKNARKLIEEEYTYEAAVKRYRKILDNLGVENYGQTKII